MDGKLRQQIRDWWKDQLEGADEIDLKAAAAKGSLALRQDPEFCERFFEEFLRPVVYEVGLNLMSQARGAATTTTMTGREVADAIGAGKRGWSDWMEYDPISGRHVLLFKMSKAQGLAAAAAREERAAPDIHRAALIRLAVGRLEDGQRIGDVWTPDELAATERRMIVGRPRVSLGPLGADARKQKAA